MQDGWLHRSSTWDGANPPPDRQALPSLRSVAPRSASAAMTSSTTTGAASSSAGHPSFRSAAPLGYQGEYQQHRPLHRAEQQQYSPEYARYPAYHEHQGDRERVYVKQEAAFEPPRDVYASPAHVFALPPPPAAAPALPKLSHMLRASSLNDVKAARPPWIQEPETEPDYTRRLAGLRTPIADRDRREIGSAKSSIGFILGGQNHATYTSSSTTMLPPARPSTIPSSSSSSGYYNQYPPHQPAPPSMTVHSSSSVYWRNEGNDLAPASRSTLGPYSLVAGGRAASAPSPTAASMQRKVETARPASRTCKFEGCEQYVVDHGLCVRHGGGKRCLTEGCTSRAKHFGRCWRHGGSIECKVDGCINRAKSRGYCWSHGGGTKCKAHPCEKIAISNGLCWAHGGGKRCVVSGCRKQAYERTRNFCNSHFQLFKKGLLPPSATALATFEALEEDARAAAEATSH